MLSAPPIILSISARAGVHGGEIVAPGSLEILSARRFLTEIPSAGERPDQYPEKRKWADPAKMLTITGASGNNLKKCDTESAGRPVYPYHRFSGSGKSTP